MGPTVWVVSIEWGGPGYRHSGGEPDYTICGVFTTEALAEAWAEREAADAEENGNVRFSDDTADTWAFDVHVEPMVLHDSLELDGDGKA